MVMPMTGAGPDSDVVTRLASPRVLDDGDTLFHILADAMPQMVWSTQPDGRTDYFNARWYEFTGVSPGNTDGDAWSSVLHPDDRVAAEACWRNSVTTGQPYEIEYRLRHHEGAYRWVIARGSPMYGAEGRVTRWIGTCTDVHDAKLQAAENELLLRELSHRIKNIFAVVNGLIGLSARAQPEAADFARDLKLRIAALGKAHDLARPHSPESMSLPGTASLQVLLRTLLAPYETGTAERITITGDDVAIDDRGATPIAMLIHELATNAAKYGALSTVDGRIHIDIAISGGTVTMSWREAGGPAVGGTPQRSGFGTRLAEMSVRQQLGGTLDYDWAETGLGVIVAVKANRLAR
jgi:PAS domain S-box-containing protein